MMKRLYTRFVSSFCRLPLSGRSSAMVTVLCVVASGCATVPQPAENDAPLTPVFGDRESQGTPDLIDSFSVVVPKDLKLCGTNNPWASGKNELVDWGGLVSGSCFSLNYTLKKPAYGFLIYEDPNGELSRLRPDDCRVSDRQMIKPAIPVVFPQGDQIIELDENPGGETFHLIVAENRELASRTLAAVLELPSPGSTCSRPKGLVVTAASKNTLKNIVESDRAAVQWMTRTILHQPAFE